MNDAKRYCGECAPGPPTKGLFGAAAREGRQTWPALIVCAGGLLLLLAGCAKLRRAPDNARAIAAEPEIWFEKLKEVNIVEAQAAPVSGPILIPAALSVDDMVVVTAPRSGPVLAVTPPEGARVEAGQILARFDEAELRNQLQQAQLDVERAKLEEQQYDAAVNVSKSELAREQSLFKEGVSSQADLERAQYRLDQAQKELEKIRIATRTAQARVGAVQLELTKTVVRAPLSAYVIKRYVNEGSTVAANEKLYELSRLAPVKLKFQVPQTSGVPLRPGQLVSLSLAGNDQIVASARIIRPEPIADAASNTYGYVAELTGNSGLRPGVAVNVHLAASNSMQAVLVPRVVFPPDTSLLPGASSTVLVVERNRAIARSVLIQGTEGDQVLIRTGLAPGDRVIVAPPPGLKTGDTITVR